MNFKTIIALVVLIAVVGVFTLPTVTDAGTCTLRPGMTGCSARILPYTGSFFHQAGLPYLGFLKRISMWIGAQINGCVNLPLC